MVYGTSFIFNGQNSQDYNLMLCSIDSDETETNLGLDYEVMTYKSNHKVFDYGATYKDVLTFNMTVIHCDETPFDRNQIREIMRWLDNCEQLKWLSYYDSEEELNINYYCRITSKEKIKCGGNIIALKFTITCNSPYAYSEIKTVELPLTNITEDNFVFTNNIYINTDCNINPCVYFNLYTPEGELNYTYFRANINVDDDKKNHSDSSFICVFQEKTLIMDCENEGIFFNDDTIPDFNNNFHEDCQFANSFINLYRGMNTITCYTNKACNKIELKYREKYKIGEF